MRKIIRCLDFGYLLDEASVKELFLGWTIYIGVLMVGVLFLFDAHAIIAQIQHPFPIQIAMIQALIEFPICLPTWILAIPMMVGTILLVRRSWFSWEKRG